MAQKTERAKDLLDWLGVRAAPDWSVARPLGWLVSVVLAALFILALLAGGALLVRTIAGGEGSFGAGALIVAVLSAPFLIWNTWIRHRALGFQKEGHLTDRLAKAVEQLGTEKTVKEIVTGDDGDPVLDKDGKPTARETTQPNLEVRIGGLLSLERIAQDSTTYDKGRDHVRVMEIISAYIRNNAPAKDAKNFPGGDLEPLAEDAESDARKAHLERIEVRKSERKRWLDTLAAPREDIMLALTILERRSDRQRRIEAAHGRDGLDEADWPFAKPAPELPEPPDDQPHPEGAIKNYLTRIEAWKQELADYSGYRPDLRGTCLQRADLAKFRLAGVRLDKARLEGANLREARLEGANLGEVHLEGADLWLAELEGASLWYAGLEGAKLWQARLEGADLWQAGLEGANLREVHLEGADLWYAGLEGADLGEARLEGADLWLAELEGANLGQARLEGANLWLARLEGANLGQARLEGAKFAQARLEGANLWLARLSESTDLMDADFAGASIRSVDFSTVAISQEQVNAGFGDASVTLPDGLSRPPHWPDQELDLGDFVVEWRRWQSDPANYTPPPPPSN